jgi:hypothetical protein
MAVHLPLRGARLRVILFVKRGRDPGLAPTMNVPICRRSEAYLLRVKCPADMSGAAASISPPTSMDKAPAEAPIRVARRQNGRLVRTGLTRRPATTSPLSAQESHCSFLINSRLSQRRIQPTILL